MASARVVERLDVAEDREPRLVTARVAVTFDPLDFERGDAALAGGVVERVPRLPIEATRPESRSVRPKASEVYCPRSTGRRNSLLLT